MSCVFTLADTIDCDEKLEESHTELRPGLIVSIQWTHMADVKGEVMVIIKICFAKAKSQKHRAETDESMQ